MSLPTTTSQPGSGPSTAPNTVLCIGDEGSLKMVVVGARAIDVQVELVNTTREALRRLACADSIAVIAGRTIAPAELDKLACHFNGGAHGRRKPLWVSLVEADVSSFQHTECVDEIEVLSRLLKLRRMKLPLRHWIDEDRLSRRLDDDDEYLQRALPYYVKDGECLVSAWEAADAAGDRALARTKAHALAGLAGEVFDLHTRVLAKDYCVRGAAADEVSSGRARASYESGLSSLKLYVSAQAGWPS
jgi:hypothetical protein